MNARLNRVSTTAFVLVDPEHTNVDVFLVFLEITAKSNKANNDSVILKPAHRSLTASMSVI